MIKMNELSDSLIVARDAYKQKYRNAIKRKEDDIKALQRDFRDGTQRFLEEKAGIERRFKKELDDAKQEAHDFLDEKFEDLQNYEIAKVKTLGNLEEFQKLNAIADLPLSFTEVRLLVEKFGSKNYYIDKVLGQIAIKNGIPSKDISAFGLQPSIDIKLQVIEQLMQQFNDLLNTYNGEMVYKTEILLSDSAIYRAEMTFTNGYSEENIDDEAVARRAFANIVNQRNETERGLALAEILNNANETIQREILYKCASSNSIGEYAFALAGVTDAIEAYRAGLGEEYERAKGLIQDVRDCGNNVDLIKTVIRQNKGNEMFLKLCEMECSRNSAVNDAACDINFETKETLIHTVDNLDKQTESGTTETEAESGVGMQ